MVDGNMADRALLETLVPPRALSPERFLELAGKAQIEALAPGTVVFAEGARDRRVCYLIEGRLALTNAKGATLYVSGGTELARKPLAIDEPRLYTAITVSDCRLVRFDADLLDILLTWDQLSPIDVRDITHEDLGSLREHDWMTRLVQSPALLQVPPANIQSLLLHFQEIPVDAGQIIIQQGGTGDYYYVIKHGKAKVSRRGKTGIDLRLAQLSDGDAFGEEALLSGSKRNATITMLTAGVLMRLAKEDFDALLKEPMLRSLSYAEALAAVKEGAKWLDVRSEAEHQDNAIPGAINIPLFMLRLRLDTLDPQVTYMVYCDSGRRSSAGAFLLNERGFEVYVLRGGLIDRAMP
jgi:CRP-like cAMP-binding protein